MVCEVEKKPVYDFLTMDLVPRIVDRNYGVLKDGKNYFRYSLGQLGKFCSRLPEEWTIKRSQIIAPEDRSATFSFYKSPVDLRVDINSRDFVLEAYEPTGCKGRDFRKVLISCPVFNISFKSNSFDLSSMVVKAALDQFFLKREEIPKRGNILMAQAYSNERLHKEGLELLADFLPVGSEINVRSNDKNKLDSTVYRILR